MTRIFHAQVVSVTPSVGGSRLSLVGTDCDFTGRMGWPGRVGDVMELSAKNVTADDRAAYEALDPAKWLNHITGTP